MNCSMNSKDVFPGSSRLIEGKPPCASLLLIGKSGVGKTIFCKQFLRDGLVNGEPCIYVTTNESPEEIGKSMRRFGFNVETEKGVNTFRIVDCYSWKLGSGAEGEYFVSNPTDLAVLLGVTEKAMRGLKNIRLVFDSITGLTSISRHGIVEISKFLQVLVAKVRLAEGNAVFTVDPEAHDQQFMSFLRQAFDGTLEMKEEESGKEMKRLLRVFSLKEAKHKTSWMPFDITDHGISLKIDVELRCVMCARPIEWEPHIEIIGGKEYSFDSPECALTYRKLKSLYGEYFE